MDNTDAHFPATHFSHARSFPRTLLLSLFILLLLLVMAWKFMFPAEQSTQILGVSTFFDNSSR